ncbi:hypothetical protein [Asticcacaulis excentricus]|uniref:hypothetical protein n=1 Tax=Asticcacaulis excentricus TaxID=78587 RepID=UPI000F82AABC|nr:hypothetical protein [Asticcacaulis excentricus]
MIEAVIEYLRGAAVVREAEVSTGRRIDLLVRWEGQRIGIELKHAISPRRHQDQIAAYEAAVDRLFVVCTWEAYSALSRAGLLTPSTLCISDLDLHLISLRDSVDPADNLVRAGREIALRRALRAQSFEQLLDQCVELNLRGAPESPCSSQASAKGRARLGGHGRGQTPAAGARTKAQPAAAFSGEG